MGRAASAAPPAADPAVGRAVAGLAAFLDLVRLAARVLVELFREAGFEPVIYGYMPVEKVSLRQRILRPVKKIVVSLGLMPKSLAGKRFLKRFVFGRLVPMPAELPPTSIAETEPPTPVSGDAPDRVHKVLYCRATLPA